MTKNNLIIGGSILLLAVLLLILLMPKTYIVTFDTMGGTTMEQIKVKKGTKIGDLAIPNKEGYTFLYWTLDGKECIKTDEITKNVTLTARWQENNHVNPEIKTYKVTFDTDGGNTIQKQTINEGNVIIMPSNPTKSGYVFIEWTLDGKTFDFNTKITKDITLKAKWEKETLKNTYTISFDTDGGSKIATKNVTEGDKVSKPSNPTKSGYTFIAWTLNGKNYDFNTKITSNITLKATWKKIEDKPVVSTKYTVTFDTMGGNKINSQSVLENNKATKPNDPVKNGYKFLGWYLNGNVYDFNSKLTNNITLVAKWEKIEEQKTYTISVSKVDEYSPDIILTVFEDGKQIKVQSIKYSDGTYLCSGSNTTVNKGEIEGETSFIVVLTNGTQVKASLK